MILSRLSSSLIPCAYGLILRDCFRNLLLILTCCLPLACSMNGQSQRVEPVDAATTLTLKKKSSKRSPYHLEIHLSGQLDGQAMVRWTDSKGTLVREAAISGDVDLRWGSDWYQSSASLHYQPENVSSGQLEVYYRFKDH
jgi:hypothetical protein